MCRHTLNKLNIVCCAYNRNTNSSDN